MNLLASSGMVGPRQIPVALYILIAAYTYVYLGRIYVLGGEKRGDDRVALTDFWYIDVIKPSVLQLPSLPRSAATTAYFTAHQACVWKDRAYVFTGSPTIYFFDLIAEKWDRLKTNGQILYPSNKVQDFGMLIVQGKMYVFGGTHSQSELGCDLFQVLDLQTLRWQHLSGFLRPLEPTWDHPGPRRYPSMWANRDELEITLMFGEADRTTAQFRGETHGSIQGHAYDDTWNYTIATNVWRRDIIRGNAPCPRSEMSTIYVGNYVPLIKPFLT